MHRKIVPNSFHEMHCLLKLHRVQFLENRLIKTSK